MGMAVGVKWAQATSERRSISDSVSHGHGVKHSEPSRLFQDLQRFHAIPKGTWLGQELTFFSACSPSTCLPHPRWPPWPLPAAGAQSTPPACCRARPSHCCSWPSASWCSSTTVFRRESHSDNVPVKTHWLDSTLSGGRARGTLEVRWSKVILHPQSFGTCSQIHL